MKSLPEFPTLLDRAVEIFADELSGHLVFFQELLEGMKDREQALTENRNALKNRLHVIKGGASFLGLEEIKASAHDGEKLFASIDQSPSCPREAEGQLKKIVEILAEQEELLRNYVAHHNHDT